MIELIIILIVSLSRYRSAETGKDYFNTITLLKTEHLHEKDFIIYSNLRSVNARGVMFKQQVR